MPRGGMNDCVLNPLSFEAVAVFKAQVQTARKGAWQTMDAMCDEFGMTASAFYDRLNDPDRFSIGQLRRLREVLGVTKEDFIRMIRPLV